jgi:hypothetical protein
MEAEYGHPWYRKNGWVTAMVAGILLLGPIMALPVLIIVLSGAVYTKGPAGVEQVWAKSTRGAVIFFAVAVTAFWLIRVYSAISR